MKTDRWFVATSMVLLFCLVSPIAGGNQPRKEGKLIVKVVAGDFNDQLRDAVVYVQGYLGLPSGVVNSTRPGWFEISLQPGLYDILVGEGSTLPVCKRVEIQADKSSIHTVKLEPDLEHLQN